MANNITVLDSTGTTRTVKTTETASVHTPHKNIDTVASITAGSVDIAGALPAGDNNIGNIDVATIAAGDNNIGNVDIATVTGTVSTNNSTTATLGSSGVFTGSSDDVKDYKSIGINVIASHASATDGLSLQFSSDGTNWDKVHLFTLPAATAKFFNLPVESRYFDQGKHLTCWDRC
jgi:hypothetical protein